MHRLSARRRCAAAEPRRAVPPHRHNPPALPSVPRRPESTRPGGPPKESAARILAILHRMDAKPPAAPPMWFWAPHPASLALGFHKRRPRPAQSGSGSPRSLTRTVAAARLRARSPGGPRSRGALRWARGPRRHVRELVALSSYERTPVLGSSGPSARFRCSPCSAADCALNRSACARLRAPAPPQRRPSAAAAAGPRRTSLERVPPRPSGPGGRQPARLRVARHASRRRRGLCG